MDPYTFQNVDPLKDNMLVFCLYKALAYLIALSNEGVIPAYDKNKVAYALGLKLLALTIQGLFVNTCLSLIVRTLYKKNSRTF